MRHAFREHQIPYHQNKTISKNSNPVMTGESRHNVMLFSTVEAKAMHNTLHGVPKSTGANRR